MQQKDGVGGSIAELTFNFTITYRSPVLSGNHYSECQSLLYQTIAEIREHGMTFDSIADRLNKERYLTVRGKQFRSAGVHCVLKKAICNGRVVEKRVSTAVFRLQHGDGR